MGGIEVEFGLCVGWGCDCELMLGELAGLVLFEE